MDASGFWDKFTTSQKKGIPVRVMDSKSQEQSLKQFQDSKAAHLLDKLTPVTPLSALVLCVQTEDVHSIAHTGTCGPERVLGDE